MDYDKLLTPEFVATVNRSVQHLNELFIRIKAYREKELSNDNIANCYDLFIEVFDLVPIMKNAMPTFQIVRGRPHWQGDDLPSYRWQLSYNWVNRDKINFGRFNREAEPVFYASVPTESKEMDYVLSSGLECCKELALEYGNPNVQDITMSGWLINQSFPVVNLCFDDLHLGDNPELKASIYGFLRTIKEHFSDDAAAFIEQFYRYFSELSRSKPSDFDAYKILVPFYNAIKNYWLNTMGETIYGLIYPSAASEAKGLNIVLEREAVKCFLKLDKVIMYRYVFVKDENRYVAAPCSDMSKVHGHRFEITNYSPPGRAAMR